MIIGRPQHSRWLGQYDVSVWGGKRSEGSENRQIAFAMPAYDFAFVPDIVPEEVRDRAMEHTLGWLRRKNNGAAMKVRSIRMMVVALTLSATVAVAAPPNKPLAVTPAVSQFDQGMAAVSRGDYATAYRLWRPLADQGNASAQYNLGFMYDNGQGVPQDYAAAVGWYRKAADQGDASAQYNLGFMYGNGLGVLPEPLRLR